MVTGFGGLYQSNYMNIKKKFKIELKGREGKGGKGKEKENGKVRKRGRKTQNFVHSTQTPSVRRAFMVMSKSHTQK